MRVSKTFWATLREAPAGLELPGQALLARAGLMRSAAVGLWHLLPVGQNAWEALLSVAIPCMASAGAQRLSLPWAKPAEGATRWQCGGSPLWAAWEIAERDVRSYRQLPQLFFDVLPHLDPNPQARAGLLGSALSRELSLIGLFASRESAQEQLSAIYQSLHALLARMGLPLLNASAGGMNDRTLLFECAGGNAPFFRCSACGVISLPQATVVAIPTAEDEPMGEREEVETPDCTTIAALAEYLQVPATKTMKVVFYTLDDERVVCAVIRGDLNIDEAKLANLLPGRSFRPSTESEVLSVGSVPGYGSPIGLRRVLVLVDPTVMAGRNLVAGANKAPYHVRNVNPRRDFSIDRVVDLRAAQAGDACPACGGRLESGVGFALGQASAQTAEMAGQGEANYLDENGKAQPIIVGSIRLNLERVLGALAETHRDGDGLCLPARISPAQVHLMGIKLKSDASVLASAEALYTRLQEAGLRVLFDDRDERPGVAFKDADLLGAPLRLTVSPRALESGGVELKWRTSPDKPTVSEEELQSHLAQLNEQIRL